MKYIARLIEKPILQAAAGFPGILLTGPRRSGKTSLLRHLFPHAQYILLEDPDIVQKVKTDPGGFLSQIKLPVILDEIQNTPELFNYIRTQIDMQPNQKGQWLLTGSQEAPLMKGVSESMAGRLALFSLQPLSTQESPLVSLFGGGFPEIIREPSLSSTWFRSYLQTYLERDVRAISMLGDLAAFRRFLSLLAIRSGSILNRTDFAAPLGMSVPGITSWINILEVTGLLLIVPPYFENFGKRLIKSPRIYFTDCGLVSYLLGIESAQDLERSPFLGPLFETFVASEIVKSQINANRQKNIYYFRDRQGLEIDFVVPMGSNRLALIEAKASQTVFPVDAAPIMKLSNNMKQYALTRLVVHRPSRHHAAGTILMPDVNTIGVEALADLISGKNSIR